MKLCFIADANSIHTARWIEPLVEDGHDVGLISYTTVRKEWHGLSDLVDLTAKFNFTKARVGVWGLWIARYVRKTRPDILHAHQATGAGWLGVMARYHPLVVSGWGSDILEEPKKRGLRPWLLRMVLRSCDVLTVPSREMYSMALALGYPETQLYYVPWGVETGVFRPEPDDRRATRRALGISDEAPLVLSPRIIDPLYNTDIVLDAVSEVADRYPELRLVMLHFFPNKGYQDRLMQQIAMNGLQRKVLWLPAQSTMSDMARLYRAADITVSLPVSEGYGFSVYESLACGTPTIISDVGGFDGVLENGVNTVKVGSRDAKAVANAIVSLLEDPQLRRLLVRNGLQVVQRHSVTQRVAQVDQLYRDILGHSG